MLALLLACADPAPLAEGAASVPQSQTACVTEVVPLPDTRVATDLSAAPATLEADLARRWPGRVSWDDTPAALDVRRGGAWDLRRRTWHGPGDSEACVSTYAWRTTATLADDAGVLDETLDVVLEGRDLWDFTLAARVETASIVGSATSNADALVIFAAHIPLAISGASAPGSWDTTLTWSDATPLGTGWFSTSGW